MSRRRKKMETLTFNDGTVREYSNAHLSDGRLYIYIQDGSTLQDVFSLLIDPEKTVKIISNGPGKEKTYEGYTKLMTVNDEGNDLITAVLKQPVVETEGQNNA